MAYLRARLGERSTWMFWMGGIGSVAGLASPFNWIGAAALFGAGLVPDGPVKGSGA